jgi:cell fate (sporulation/competence/biofilm development) regulator YlbF (YheA/YmcA/DUF963 family)
MNRNEEVAWHEILMAAQELGEQIVRSERIYEYQSAKQFLQDDTDAQFAMSQFEQAKRQWEETERYGIYHPTYQEALTLVQDAQIKMEQLTVVSQFKHAERNVDELLFHVSEMIAHSVSEEIKVPSNTMKQHSKGCGGSCNGGCG